MTNVKPGSPSYVIEDIEALESTILASLSDNSYYEIISRKLGRILK
jgi:hypothetical protein